MLKAQKLHCWGYLVDLFDAGGEGSLVDKIWRTFDNNEYDAKEQQKWVDASEAAIM